jgi:hypothetical protein
MDDLARLAAVEEIKKLKARYYRFLDTHDWDAFEMVFTEDAEMDVSVEDRVFWPEGAPNKRLHGFGHEHETYRREDGMWRIAGTKLVRARTEMERA